ncbi:hypothetical protein Slin15195_G021210 [Septoria linicola]|uniref:Uncharacterized protein n=1 Tax=Septoria linicola TaxID=215465 RepID=A0A9Q9AGP0_9PEZI|nr:hypothetical protein Slin15195_G021210 [Septoria linicola]
MALIWLPILFLSPYQEYFHNPKQHQYPPFFFGVYMACSITIMIPMLYGELYEAYDRWRGLRDEIDATERTWQVRVIEFLRTRGGRVVIGALFARKALWTLPQLLHKGPHEMGFTVGTYIFLLFFVAKRY